MKKSIVFFIIFLILLLNGYFFYNHSFFGKSILFASINHRPLAAMESEKKAEAHRPDFPDQAQLEEITLRSEIGKPFSYHGNWRFDAFKQATQTFFINKAEKKLTWVERGPSDVGGRTRAIVVHPKNDNIWWAGSVGGGIWYSEDGGQNWTCQSDNMPVISVTALAICDSQPSVLYAGTGEGFYNYDAIVGDGVFKTANGGQTWEQLASTAGNVNFRYVNRIVVHPEHPDTVFVATNMGLYRSFDGGESWSEIFNNGQRVQQIVQNPLNPNSLFICVYATGIFKSVDLGEHWTYVSEEITTPRRIEMAISIGDTNYVYAAPLDTSNGLLGLLKSHDGGHTWLNLGDSVNWLGKQGWYDNTLVVHPFDPEIIFVGGINLYKINTHNDRFVATQISQWYHNPRYPFVHADHHILVALPCPDSTFALIDGTDGGVYYSADGGHSWEARNHGYNVTQFYDADRNPEMDRYIGGTQDNGTQLSPEKPDKHSDWQEVISGDGFDCVWDEQNPDVVYATLYGSEVYKSSNGGDGFRLMDNGLPESRIFHTPLIMDPNNHNKLMTASDTDKVYITWDGAESWHAVDVDFGQSRWLRMAFSEKDTNIVWAASDASHINVSTDGGRHFHVVSKPQNAPNARVTGLATSPFDSATALAMFGVYGYGKIFRTRDLGQTWEDVTNNLPEIPVHCAIIMPYDSTQIWLGTDIGLFISYNNGRTWNYANQNLPAVSLRRLKIVGKQIVAATHGRGVWTVNNDSLEIYSLPLQEPSLADLNPPNPNTNRLKIKFTPRGMYDSLQIVVNEKPIITFYTINAYRDTFYLYPVQAPDFLKIHVDGYKDGQAYISETKSIQIYAAIDSAFYDFDHGEAPFAGNFLISQDDGFPSATLHTEHPYHDKTEYLALLNPPVTVSDSLTVGYQDIAVVEPGDPGSKYPDVQMWDYVTLEGSSDGEHWDILLTPYDARFNDEWLSAYKEKRPPDAHSFVDHDTLLSAFYSAGTKIYLRFRLHADDSNHGWGWSIDNVFISKKKPTAIAPTENLVYAFRLYGNYPNPFNPQTTITFTLGKTAPVSLTIYNALGQKVRRLLVNRILQAGVVHKINWDGTNDSGHQVSSGVYFYRLQSDKNSALKKMLLLR